MKYGAIFCLLLALIDALPDAADPVHFELALFFLSAPKTTLNSEIEKLQKSDAFRAVTTLRKGDQVNHICLHADIAPFENYRPPTEASLKYFGRGLTPEQGKRLQSSPAIWVVDFFTPSAQATQGVELSSRFMQELARDKDALIWDEETRELFAPALWKTTRVDNWDQGLPDIRTQITMHEYLPGGRELPRVITLGMSKFGCPDLVINGITHEGSRACGNLVNALCQQMIEHGAPAPDAKSLAIDLRKLRQKAFKTDQLKSLKDNGTGQVTVDITPGKREEGDPDNRLLEITFDQMPGKTPIERQEAALCRLFGATDRLTYVKHDDELLAARDRAHRVIIETQKKDFIAGLRPGEVLLVKAPFKTPKNTNEWMWVEVVKWKSTQIQGILQNDPFDVPTLKSGSDVTVEEGDLFDYIRRHADGSTEGNETGKIMEAREKQAK